MNFRFYFTFKWIPGLREKKRERAQVVRPAKLRHHSLIPHHYPAKLRHKHPSSIPHLSPPLPYHRSTNTQDPQLWLPAMHRRVQVKLRSWQSTAGCAPTSPPSRSEPCISFSSSPPKTDLVLDPPKTDLVANTENRHRRWRPISLSFNLSIFLSLIFDFFVVVVVVVVWVVVVWWFLCCVVVGFMWIVVDFL